MVNSIQIEVNTSVPHIRCSFRDIRDLVLMMLHLMNKNAMMEIKDIIILKMCKPNYPPMIVDNQEHIRSAVTPVPGC